MLKVTLEKKSSLAEMKKPEKKNRAFARKRKFKQKHAGEIY